MTGPLVPLFHPLPLLLVILIRSNMQHLHVEQDALLILRPDFWLISNSLQYEVDKADSITSINTEHSAITLAIDSNY